MKTDDLVSYLGKNYAQGIRRINAWFGGPIKRGAIRLGMDDALGVILVDHLIDFQLPFAQASTHAIRVFLELEKRGVLPSQVEDPSRLPRIVVRIHHADTPRPIYETRKYDRWPSVETGQTDERWNEGPFTVSWYPEHALGMTPTTPVIEVEPSSHVRSLLDFWRGLDSGDEFPKQSRRPKKRGRPRKF